MMTNIFLIACGTATITSFIVSIITSKSVSKREVRKAKLSYGEGRKSANRKKVMKSWIATAGKPIDSGAWKDTVNGTTV